MLIDYIEQHFDSCVLPRKVLEIRIPQKMSLGKFPWFPEMPEINRKLSK